MGQSRVNTRHLSEVSWRVWRPPGTEWGHVPVSWPGGRGGTVCRRDRLRQPITSAVAARQPDKPAPPSLSLYRRRAGNLLGRVGSSFHLLCLRRRLLWGRGAPAGDRAADGRNMGPPSGRSAADRAAAARQSREQNGRQSDRPPQASVQ